MGCLKINNNTFPNSWKKRKESLIVLLLQSQKINNVQSINNFSMKRISIKLTFMQFTSENILPKFLITNKLSKHII